MITENKILKELEALYSKIDSEGREAIQNSQEKIDPFLNNLEQDRRFGLTLLIKIPEKVTGSFRRIEEEIQKVEPEQYFYPEPDLHVTVVDLVSASAGFKRDEPLIGKSVQLIENAVKRVPPFTIRFQGIIISNAAILVKGYYRDGLQDLRNIMRKTAHEEGINLQERYQSISSHSTIVRYMSALQNRKKFLTVVQNYHELEMGTVLVNELELVIHDWYNRRKEVIKKFVFNDRN